MVVVALDDAAAVAAFACSIWTSLNLLTAAPKAEMSRSHFTIPLVASSLRSLKPSATTGPVQPWIACICAR